MITRDPESGYTTANPRGHDIYSGAETKWIDITDVPAHVHAFTVCYFGSEEFLPETPFVLALVEIEGVNTLMLTRLMGLDPQAASQIGCGVGAMFTGECDYLDRFFSHTMRSPLISKYYELVHRYKAGIYFS